MSDAGGPYLFDVGVIALGHTQAPGSDTALSFLRDGIAGDIDAIVPYPAVIGAHIVLTTYYGVSNADASRLLQNFMDAKRIHWHGQLSDTLVRDGFDRAAAANVGGWDGYYAQVAATEGVNTLLTIDDDFRQFDEFDTEIILSSDQFQELNRYLSD
jgi:predicted nucleic acid-binding protein